jgi:hypothetical protein
VIINIVRLFELMVVEFFRSPNRRKMSGPGIFFFSIAVVAALFDSAVNFYLKFVQ